MKLITKFFLILLVHNYFALLSFISTISNHYQILFAKLHGTENHQFVLNVSIYIGSK